MPKETINMEVLVGWGKEQGYVQVGVERGKDSLWADLTEADIDSLIKNLKKAKRQAW